VNSLGGPGRPGQQAPRTPKPERVIVYVDGFNLYHGLHDEGRCRHLWLDLVALAQSLRPRSDLVHVHYFTTPVDQQPDALRRQQLYLSALEAHSGRQLRVTLGRYQRKEMRCRDCGATWTHREEKETDVNIAVQLVLDAAANAMDAALIISADSDLAPAVKAARLLKPKLFVAAAFPPKRFSAELKKLMPSSFHIGLSKITGAQLPPSVMTQTNLTFDRPLKWRPDGPSGRDRRGRPAPTTT
jgi:uncharacterized LabA/DUF88 family protein